MLLRESVHFDDVTVSFGALRPALADLMAASNAIVGSLVIQG